MNEQTRPNTLKDALRGSAFTLTAELSLSPGIAGATVMATGDPANMVAGIEASGVRPDRLKTVS